MCGFLLYNFLILNDILTKANELLKLRGPDDMNVFNYSGYTFVHNVLSITGEKTLQPFIEESKRIVCLYNGEIYNYKEFNKEYKSDGECIIPMYLKHGHEYASHLDGEFAIVIINFRQMNYYCHLTFLERNQCIMHLKVMVEWELPVINLV